MFGMPPYNTYGKVPGLSHYFHDIVPYYLCCHWSNQCDVYLYLRETKDAKGYKEARIGIFNFNLQLLHRFYYQNDSKNLSMLNNLVKNRCGECIFLAKNFIKF